MLVSPSSKIALPYVEHIGGPILLTAPHGLKLSRPRRKHLREKYTSEIVLLLAKAIGKLTGKTASFCVWNYKTARKADPHNLDPNYLFQSEWQNSPFHTALLKFRSKFKHRNVPCFHLDFHGKGDRKKTQQHHIDVGIQPFLEHPTAVGWNDQDVVALRSSAATALDTAFQGLTVGGRTIRSDEDPRLHGWWGDDEDDEECETTMTHQAVLLGIPSLQLETPRSVRRALRTTKHENYIDRMAVAIVEMYNQTVHIEHKHGLGSTAEADGGTVETKSTLTNAATAASFKGVVLPFEQLSPVDTGCAFFVYGSLRPDDVTGMPWRDGWLAGSACKRGEIEGKMYDDQYACVVVEGTTGTSTVQGWLVEYPSTLYNDKLKEGDGIEGYPDLYNRKRVAVRCLDGTATLAWVYVRPDCSKKNRVPHGDWVAYQQQKQHGSKKNKKDHHQTKELNDFIAHGFPEYVGQHDCFGGKGGVGRMIDAMVSDCTQLDKFDPDRQV